MTRNEHGNVQPLREAFAALAERARPRPDCPEPERLWDAAAGQLPATQARQLVDHTASCPSCAEAWRLARELGRHAREGRPAVGSALSRGGWRWAAAAAAAVVLALVGVQLWWTRPVGGPPAEYRDPDIETIRSLLTDGAFLPREEFRLRWEAPPDAARFDVLVMTEELEVISRTRGLETPEYRVPDAQLEALPPGTRVLWQVEAVLEDGGSAVSPTFVNRLE